MPEIETTPVQPSPTSSSRNEIVAAAGLVVIVVVVWFFWDDIMDLFDPECVATANQVLDTKANECKCNSTTSVKTSGAAAPLTCEACPANSSPNSDGSSCVCDTGFNADAAPFTGPTNGLCEQDHQPRDSGCVGPDCAPTPDLAGNVAGARGVTVGNLGSCNPSTADDGGAITNKTACEAAAGAWTPYTQVTSSFCMGPWTNKCTDGEGGIIDMVDGACPSDTTALPRHPTGCSEDMAEGCPQTCFEIPNPCVPDPAAAAPQGESCHIIEDQGVQKCSDGCKFDPSRQASCSGNADTTRLGTCTGQPTAYCVVKDQNAETSASPLQACKGADGRTTMEPDENSGFCAADGCIPYTPPDCSFIEHEDGRLACPHGCVVSEEYTPICDLDFRTDPDDNLCPRGCILTQGALCMSACGFSQCEEQGTCVAKHGTPDAGRCARAESADMCAGITNAAGVPLCTYSKLSSTCRDCLNNCSNDDTACLETCNTACPGDPCVWSSDGSCPTECIEGTSESPEIKDLKIEWHQPHPESGQSPTQVPVMFAETQPGSTVGSITIALPQDRRGDIIHAETQQAYCPEGSDASAPVYYEGHNQPATRILCGCWSPCTEACENGSGNLEITGLEAQRAGIDEWWEHRAWEEESGAGTWQEGGIIESWGAIISTDQGGKTPGGEEISGADNFQSSAHVPNTWQTRRFMPAQYSGSQATNVCHEAEFLKHPKMVYPPPCHGGDGGCKNCNDAQEPFGPRSELHDVAVDPYASEGRWISIPASMYDALDAEGKPAPLLRTGWLHAQDYAIEHVGGQEQHVRVPPNLRARCRIMNDHEYTTLNYKGIEPICISTNSGHKINLPDGPECTDVSTPAATSGVPTQCTGLWDRYANVVGKENELGTTTIDCPPSRFCPAEDGACEAAGGEWRTRGASWIQCDEWTDPAGVRGNRYLPGQTVGKWTLTDSEYDDRGEDLLWKLEAVQEGNWAAPPNVPDSGVPPQINNMCACPAGQIFQKHITENKFRCIDGSGQNSAQLLLAGVREGAVQEARGDSHRVLQDYGSMGLSSAPAPWACINVEDLPPAAASQQGGWRVEGTGLYVNTCKK